MKRHSWLLSRGQILALTSLVIVVTLAIAALAVDVGLLWDTRREMQTAADAAATAAVNDLAQQDTTDLTQDAQNAASQNGFTNGGTTAASAYKVTVSVSNPPPAGNAFAGNTNAVQVTVSQTQPTQFLQFVPGLNLTSVPVSVTSTALARTGGACIYSLDPSSSGAMDVQGTATVNSSCGMYDDSNNPTAFTAGGTPQVTAPYLGVVGGSSVTGGASVPIATRIPAFGDPLSYIGQPSAAACASYPGTNVNSTTTLSPGEFCGGLLLNASANVTFSPGLYVINGGTFQINASATASGSGVTFFVTGNTAAPGQYGGVKINGGATVKFSAPSSCTTAGPGGINGVLFFQDRTLPTTSVGSTINGGSGSFFDGALYFPTTVLTYNGNSASGGYTYIVSYDLKFAGTTSVSNNYSCLSGGSLIKDASLVQ